MLQEPALSRRSHASKFPCSLLPRWTNHGLEIAIPLLLNPVGIVSLTVFSAEAQRLLQIGLLVILVLVVAAIDLGVFLISHRLDKYLTNERILVLEKLLGIFLAALAVQLIINGLADLHIITVSAY